MMSLKINVFYFKKKKKIPNVDIMFCSLTYNQELTANTYESY